MYGQIGKFTAAPGRRDDLIAVLLNGTKDMPGCLSYVIAKDAQNGDVIWITETWDTKESHAASLQLPAVQHAIAQAKPMIAGMERTAQTEPLASFYHQNA
ncbi:putative quinol monooxygenase [Parvularcula sp. LCG005]|uniref:putative quinol monooxygenase n=1 Tax=Parvularcula sp. LCG005 TaxID=3078805 RepID=UPI002943E590|nr:putative quinol monooxygenase [Parvularcula sp. LCG005]WOI54776.1 putative quinol monooxygenase [Parvularcula sp. LCG005]